MSTAFVLAGGGSIGAVQVGMLREFLAHGVAPELVVGSSAGAINGAYLAGAPGLEGVRRGADAALVAARRVGKAPRPRRAAAARD